MLSHQKPGGDNVTVSIKMHILFDPEIALLEIDYIYIHKYKITYLQNYLFYMSLQNTL